MFDRANGAQFDYVFNCGGESRYSQAEEVYRLRSHALSVALGKEAARRGVRAFIECSTATVYKSDRTPKKETGKIKPLYDLSKWKFAAEEELQKIPGLNMCILRLAHVYGLYDSGFLTTPICLSRVYKDLERPLPFPFPKEQLMHSVHVKDAARAMWTAAEWRSNSNNNNQQSTSSSSNDDDALPNVFNIVDHNNTTKGNFADALTREFDIECSFMNAMMVQLAKMNAEEVFGEVNEEALEVWADLLEEKGITRPGPLTPFLEQDYLKDGDVCVDGGLFERTTGFKYEFEKNPPQFLRSLIDSYERMNWWP